MSGNVFRRVASATALSFLSTLLVGVPVASAQAVPDPFNPNLPDEACGLEFALVIDRSGSVAGNAGTVKSAANAFLEALVDTGSKVSLTSFATDATVNTDMTVNSGVVSLTAASLVGSGGLTAKVNGLTFANYTNWEDGLIKAQSTFPGFSGGKPDLVVMITDGYPNRYINTSGDVDDGPLSPLAEAVGQAEAIKAGLNGSHMFALGVSGTDPINTTALQAISGVQRWPDNAFDVADWTEVTSFSALKTALLDIATELCGGTVTVEKFLDGGTTPVPGWHFSASGSPAPIATPVSGNTNAQGMVQFDWDSAQNVTTNLTETVGPGYAFVSASCARNGGASTVFSNGGQLVVGPLDVIRCKFNNRTLAKLIMVDKKTPSTTVVPGSLVPYTFEVKNEGEVPLSNVGVSDDTCTVGATFVGDTNGNDLLDLTETWTYTCSHIVTQTTTNIATATGTPPFGPPVTDDDQVTVTVSHPGLTIVKSGPTQAREGQTVTYDFLVTNTGDVTLSQVVVTDSIFGTIGTIPTILATNPDTSVTLHKTYLIPTPQILDVVNLGTACATGAGPNNTNLCVSDGHTLDVIHPAFTVVKSGPTQAREGQTVTYDFLVTNTGDVALSNLSVIDDVAGALPTIVSLPSTNPDTSVLLHKTYLIPLDHPLNVVNVVTVCVPGAGPGGNGPLCHTATHTLDVLHPEILVDKTVDLPVITAGTEVTYGYAVTNPGDIALSGVTLDDDVCPADDLDFLGGDTDHVGFLDHGETWTYTCSMELAVDTLNTATATGTPPVGADVTHIDTQLVDVVNPLLQVRKTGATQAHEGDTITYTFTVTNMGDVTLTGLNVVDDVLGPIGDTIESLAVHESVVLTETYTIPANRTADVVNTVTVCTDGPAPGTPEDAADLCDTEIHVLDVLHPGITIDKTANPISVSVSGPVTYTYVVTNTGDTVLHNIVVTDNVIPGVIGTVDSLAPGASKTFTKTVEVDADTPPTNIGKVTGTDDLGRTVSKTDDATIGVVLALQEAKAPPVVAALPLAPAVLPAVAVAPQAELPRTGSPIGTEALLGFTLLQAGLAFQFISRRRRRLGPDAG